IDDFYSKKTHQDLVGYYPEEGAITYLYRNREWPTSKLVAIRKSASGLRMIEDAGPYVDKYLASVRTAIEEPSTDGVTFAYTSPCRWEDKVITLSIGKNAIKIPARSFVNYMDGKAGVPKELAEFLDKEEAPKDIIFFRDSFLQSYSSMTETQSFIMNV